MGVDSWWGRSWRNGWCHGIPGKSSADPSLQETKMPSAIGGIAGKMFMEVLCLLGSSTVSAFDPGGQTVEFPLGKSLSEPRNGQYSRHSATSDHTTTDLPDRSAQSCGCRCRFDRLHPPRRSAASRRGRRLGAAWNLLPEPSVRRRRFLISACGLGITAGGPYPPSALDLTCEPMKQSGHAEPMDWKRKSVHPQRSHRAFPRHALERPSDHRRGRGIGD